MSENGGKAELSTESGEALSATPSITLLKRRLGIAPTPRMLSRYEIELLKQSEREVAQVTREILARKNE